MPDKIIQPSSFRRRITVKTPVTLQDAAGGIETSGYEPLFSTWALVDQMSTNRLAFYGMDLFQNAWEVVFRYTPSRNITVGSVIEYEGQDIIVKSSQLVRQDYKTFLTLICIQSEIQ